VYAVTQAFPSEERYGLSSQLRRSAVSVSSNIAEGSSRSSETDFARFIEIAYGSLLESVSELEVARRQGFLSRDSFGQVYEGAETVARQQRDLSAGGGVAAVRDL
jgi:four helix bundle protein